MVQPWERQLRVEWCKVGRAAEEYPRGQTELVPGEVEPLQASYADVELVLYPSAILGVSGPRASGDAQLSRGHGVFKGSGRVI